ncbi:MAG: TetR/AcrR family transcriptional regulator [Actinomycetaceae bacterium]|nr:TetR/AcrR family transcriptional regulator [Actinomycetaceae bacterium]
MAVVEKTRGSYATGEARVQSILDATVELLMQFGYCGISIRDVARRVGISHPGVIYHFPSKEALLMAVIDRYQKQANYSAETLEAADAYEVIEAFWRLVRTLSSNTALLDLHVQLSQEASSGVHPAHEHFEKDLQIARKALTRAFFQFQKEGLLIANFSPEIMTERMMSAFFGLGTLHLYDASVNVAAGIARTYATLVDMLNPRYLGHVNERRYTDPVLLQAIHEATGKDVVDFYELGMLDIKPEQFTRMELGDLSPEVVGRILQSGIVGVAEFFETWENGVISDSLFKRVISSDLISEDDRQVLLRTPLGQRIGWKTAAIPGHPVLQEVAPSPSRPPSLANTIGRPSARRRRGAE